MSWAVDYTGAAVPTSSSPAWTRTGSPSTEAVSGGILHLAQGGSASAYYSLAEASPTAYTTHEILATWRRVLGGSGRNDVAVQIRAKGAFLTQVSIVSDTQVLIETYTGSTWTSDTKTVASMGSTLQNLRVVQIGGTLSFYWNGSLIHTYSGTQNTAQTDNQIFFGDLDAGSSSASDAYYDRVWAYYGTTDTTPLSGGTLAKILVGEAAGTAPRVFGATNGQAYRILDSAGLVVQSAVVSGGVAAFTNTGLPVNGGSLVGYTDNTYATPISGQSWAGLIRRGNVFEASPARLGVAGVKPISNAASYYYPTAQTGGRGQIVQTTNYWFVCYRVGATTPAGTGGVEIVRISRSTGLVDQGPVSIRSSISDGHEFFGIAAGPTGKIRFVAGGYGGSALIFKETSSAEDITAWTSETTIHAGSLGSSGFYQVGGVYVTAADGTNHMVLNDGAGNNLVYGTATNASPTSWTWTTVVAQGATNWGTLLGDVAYDETNGRVGFTFGCFKRTGSYSDADYKNIYFVQYDVASGTLKKADGTSAGSAPLAMNDTTGAVTGGDQVVSGTHYGTWSKLTYVAGVPYVLVDNQFDTATMPAGSTPGVQSMAHWSGTLGSWVSNTIPDLPMWGNVDTIPPGDSAWTFFADHWNWGVLVGSVGSTVYVYACIGKLINAYRDSGHNGFQVKRFRSVDGFASYATDVLLDDTYTPFQYSELDDGSSRPAGAYGAGFCYPKVPANDPRTVVFSVVDEEQSTVMLTSLPWFVATHTLDGVVAVLTTSTKTHTLDGVVIAPGTASHTLDGVVQVQGATKTHTLDGVVVVSTATQYTKTHTLDGVVKARGNELAHSLDGIVVTGSPAPATTLMHDTYTVAGTGGQTRTRTANQITVAEISDTSPLPS